MIAFEEHTCVFLVEVRKTGESFLGIRALIDVISEKDQCVPFTKMEMLQESVELFDICMNISNNVLHIRIGSGSNSDNLHEDQ